MKRPGWYCGWLSVACCLVASNASPAADAAGTAAPTTGLIEVLAKGIPHAAFFGLALDGGTGIAVGAGGAVAESADAGRSWKPGVSAPTELALLAVDRRGAHTVAVGQSGLVMVQAASGQWAQIKTGSKERLFSVGVNANGLAVAVGQFGTVLKSDDGGQSWRSVAPAWSDTADAATPGTDEPSLYSAHVADSGEITIAGEFGVMLRSADAGKTWRVLRPVKAGEPSIFAMSFARGEGNSYAVGQKGELLISGDGGLTWTRREPVTQSNFLGVAAAPGGYVVITGMRVMLRSLDDGANWTAVEEGDTTTDWYQAVRAEPTSGRIVAVGHGGRIIRIGSPSATASK